MSIDTDVAQLIPAFILTKQLEVQMNEVQKITLKHKKEIERIYKDHDEELELKVDMHQDECDDYNFDINQNKDEIQFLNQKLKEESKVEDDNDDGIEKLKIRLIEKRKEVDRLQKLYEESKNKEIEDIGKKIKQKDEKIKKLKGDYDKMEKDTSKETLLSQKNVEYNQFKDKLRELKKEYEKTNCSLLQTQTEYQSLEKIYGEKVSENENLKTTIGKLNGEITELRNKITNKNKDDEH